METRIHEDQGIGESGLVWVESTSRPGHFHRVDVDRDLCSCEARSFGNPECRHPEDAKCAYCLGYGTLISYPKLVECAHCSGSGLAA